VTLKLRLSDFTLRTHARSLARAVEGREEFARLAQGLLDQVLPLPQSVRLMGLTLSALEKRAEGRRCLLWAGATGSVLKKGKAAVSPFAGKPQAASFSTHSGKT
jgi:hypothetical protein